MSATVNFSNELTPSSETTDIHFIGRKSILESLIKSDSSVLKPLQSYNSGSIMEAMIGRLSGGPSGDSSSTFVPLDIETDSNDAEDKFVNLNFVSIPEKVSRHNHHMSPHVISALVSKVTPKSGKVKIFVAGSSSGDTTPIAAAIARSFPLYDSKTGDNDKDDKKDLSIDVCFLDESFAALSEDSECKYLASAEAVAKGVRLAAKFGDMPPAELTTDAYADECKRIAEELGESVTYEEIIGEELNKLQYGGIYGVGKAAECPPRLITMTYTPPEFSESIALCGKGVVYDTGGLSLKPKTGMGGMKHDMGGSAGLLGGFCAAVELKVPTKITLLLGIVENAIGPLAVRNDDILKMHSGKTVEINNTDAEGRLVLGDCVSHASKNLDNIDLIIDMATLTGAQLVATGKKHAGILANTEEAEKRAYDAGMRSGDLVYPLLYAPELLKHEFASKVADMKNSVKDRGNAQTSCAGHFIESHIDSSFEGGWVHVDMAGPSTNGERATGYGVGLVLAMVNAPELS
eukprot:CAMPEP_0203673788 /NCGR_PEP_ID=MMETSP0090-20130426/13822_1 /ASSEMBLY_ACC=CAM_ASM_001088 /TAXON_ID=426623 /ORGANISM="Chaetoceros affinis, Strain CCMP159" /LENGTH=517 /DNA_ID=CAMNT_0050539509 /DNA_START=145 /DNA_END=1698 /DNA_ORIENTATION=-